MENVAYKVYAQPVTDKNGKIPYRRLKVYKVKGNQREELIRGKLLTFVASQFEKIEEKLEPNQRVILEIPLDFLLAQTLMEALPLNRVNLLLYNPVSNLSPRQLQEIRTRITEYTSAGLEISLYLQTFERYRLFKISFVCLPPDKVVSFPKRCFYNVDTPELFEKVKPLGELFCGKLFGDFKEILEITALSYLQTTVSRALELVESDDFDVEQLEKLLKSDPKLSVSLLKFVNAPLIAPPTPIRDIKHALVYLGARKIKEFLLTIMVTESGKLDKDLEDLVVRLGAVGLLMEQKGREAQLPFSACQLFLSGLVLEGSKLLNKSVDEILELLSVPTICFPPLEDKRVVKLYEEITPEEKEKAVLELKKLLSG
jgi:c-di-GMP-related signal transduction protein